MQAYNNLKRILKSIENGTKFRSVSGNFAILNFSWVMPAAATVGVLATVAAVDQYLYDNPDVQKRIIANEKSYFQSLRDGVEASLWNDPTKSPKAFIMSLLLDMPAHLREKLMAILDRMSPERLRLLARFLQVLELAPEQLQQLTTLMIKILESSQAEKIIDEVIVDLIEKVQEGVGISALPTVAGATAEDIKKSEEQLKDLKEQFEEKTEKELAEALEQLILETDPDKLTDFLSAIADLPPNLQATVNKVLATLIASDASKLREIVSGLNANQMAPVIQNLARLTKIPASILVNRFHQASSQQVVKASKVLGAIPTKTVSELIVLTEPFSNKSFFNMIEIVSNLKGNNIKKFISIGQKAGPKTLEKAVELFVSLDKKVQTEAISVLANLGSSTIPRLVNVASSLGSNASVKNAFQVLYDIRNVAVQEKAVDIWDNINSTSLLKDGLQVLSDINIKATKQVINQVHTVTVAQQNKSFDILSRINTKESNTQVTRIENLAQRFTDVNKPKVLGQAVDTVQELNDKALNQAVSVILDVGTPRTEKAVRTFTRMDKTQRTGAVDTLDDIKVAHLKTAVDIVDTGDRQLLADSVEFTENLKGRLKRDDALKTTERAINVASRVDTTAQRQRGLDGLRREREVRVRRIMKQVDGQTAVFKKNVITGVSEEYTNMNTDNKDKFANILSGSDGLFFGAKSGVGSGRKVTQERKLFRIDQYFTEKDSNPSQFTERVTFVKERPVSVFHKKEQNFQIKQPSAVAGVRGKFKIPDAKIKD